MSTNKKPLTITRAKLEQIKREVSAKALTIFTATAMDEFNWTDEDLERFAQRLGRYYSAVDEGLLSIHKVQKIIEEVMGIDINTR